jgi:hypothetical protein
MVAGAAIALLPAGAAAGKRHHHKPYTCGTSASSRPQGG